MMRSLKVLLIGIAILSSGTMMAQDNRVNKEVIKKGDLLEAVFYHENGQIAQQGTYKGGELHGEWVSYDINGNKTAMGKYDQGEKVGKWFFWNSEELAEVDYKDSRVAAVNYWKNESHLVSK